MLTIEDIQFNSIGWLPHQTAEHCVVWKNSQGDLLTKCFYPSPPRMPGLFRTQDLLNYYQQLVSAEQGAIISAELLHFKGTAISKLLFKTWATEEHYRYVGRLTLAYRDFSYTISLEACEQPGDEVRVQRAWQAFEASQPAGTDLIASWFGEPTPEEEYPIRRTPADDLEWDREFPQHPLSRLRTELSRLLPTLQIGREVKNSSPHNV